MTSQADSLLGHRRLAVLSRGVLLASLLSLAQPIPPCFAGRAQAASPADKTADKAKQARQLYRKGKYEEAADVYVGLIEEHPDSLAFTRNLGACYYYLRRPEPALSNLREYLLRNREIAPEDRREVEAWIAEMQNLRDQAAPRPAVPPVGPKSPTVTAALPVPAAAPATQGAPVGAAAPVTVPAIPAPAPEPARGSALLTSDGIAAAKPTDDHRPIYKKWWFWTGIGAVVVSGTVTAILLSRRSDSSPCGGINFSCVEVR